MGPMTARPVAWHPLSLKRATVRLTLSVAIGIVAGALVNPTRNEWWLRGLAGWDAASLTLAALAWTIIMRADPSETERRAGTDDPGRKVLFLIALASSLVSLFAAGMVLRLVKTLPPGEEVFWTTLAFAAVVLSWTVTHTAYTLRYANLYYRARAGRPAGECECLLFPGGKDPADIDFAYFAFTVGMCFQVSDVMVATTLMRREVLVHAVLSFAYNTMIVALALNLAIGLLS
jgi:uncharacterized membrane protein